MSNKRKKAELQARREAKETKRLKAEGRLENGIVIPAGAIPADVSKQQPTGPSYSRPLYYVDYDFTCVDCGIDQVWTAAQQQWYYEEAKCSIYATAVRCRACRQRRPAELSAQHKDSEA